MAKEVDEIVVGANGTVRIAPIGTAAPADSAVAPAAGWLDLGYLSEDGVTLTDARTIEKIPVWQLFYAARMIVTERDFMIAFVMRQWSEVNVPLAFGGGVVSTVTAGNYKYTPPAPELIDERAAMVDWVDGTKKYRLIVPRCLVTENVETNLSRTAAADLPITLSIVGDDSADNWYLLTNDPAINPA